jgi:hypothetical protein
MKVTHIQVRSFSPNFLSHKASVHFYSLEPTRNKGVYALSLQLLVVLLFVSGSKWWTQVSSAVTIRYEKASSSASKRANNSEEMAFLSVLRSIVRFRGTHLAHHPWSRIFQAVREIEEALEGGGGKWSASRPWERTPGTHGTGGWVGFRAGLHRGDREKNLLSLPGIEHRSPGRPVRSQTLYWLSYPAPKEVKYRSIFKNKVRTNIPDKCIYEEQDSTCHVVANHKEVS